MTRAIAFLEAIMAAYFAATGNVSMTILFCWLTSELLKQVRGKED